MLDLKEKLPEVSLFHLAGLLTVTLPEERDCNGKIAWKKIILVKVQKVCEWHLCFCDECVLLQYYFFLTWLLFTALLMLLFDSDSTSKLESLFMGSYNILEAKKCRKS